MNEKLTSYTLPPDMLLAQAKVEETRQELANLLENIASVYNTGT